MLSGVGRQGPGIEQTGKGLKSKTPLETFTHKGDLKIQRREKGKQKRTNSYVYE